MTQMFNNDDQELIQAIIKKDQDALAELYSRYGGRVYNLAHYIVRQDSAAEEITQDVFLQIWRVADRWDASKGQLVSWILTITRHYAIDRLRRDKNKPTHSTVSLEDVINFLPADNLIDDPSQDNGRLLRALILTLPLEQRQVIQLAYFRGMTHTEIAEMLDLPLGTVKSRIRLALQKLKEGWLAELQEKDRKNE